MRTLQSNAMSNQIKIDLADGLLVIDLVREVPDAVKPKKIA